MMDIELYIHMPHIIYFVLFYGVFVYPIQYIHIVPGMFKTLKDNTFNGA